QHRSLEIDNVWGSIEVLGTASDEARLTVSKSIRAASKDKLEQARKEVTLDISEQEGFLKLYVNGPFRCHCDDGCGHREFDGYIVKMDFQIQVPGDIDIRIKRSEEHTSELQSRRDLVCRLLLEKKKKGRNTE